MSRIVTCYTSLLLATCALAVAQEHRIQFDGLPLRAALDSVQVWCGVSIIYLDRDVEGKRVTAVCEKCDCDQALGTVLAGSGLTWIRRGNQVILRQSEAELIPRGETISGTVIDSLTGEWVGGASVMLYELRPDSSTGLRRVCPANASGYFALRNVPAGTYQLRVRYLGYLPFAATITVDGISSSRIDPMLGQSNITMQEVTVEGRRSALTSVAGLARGLYVPSAPADQNEYLLDGARIYNPSHFGGVLGTFSPEAMNDVDISTAGLSPYYGGRIGGILDLSLRDGARDRLHGSVGASSLDAQLSLEGPIASSGTFLLSGRRGYPDPQIPSLADHGTPGHLGSTELIGRIAHRISAGERLFLDAYIGRDAFSNYAAGNGVSLSNTFAWRNTMINMRWVGVASPSLFLQLSGAYTRYALSMEHVATGSPTAREAGAWRSAYAIQDLNLRAHAEHYYDQDHTLSGGVELVRHAINGTISAFDTQRGPMSLAGGATWELALYLQDRWQMLPRLQAEVGVRATSFTAAAGSFSGLDPRFSLQYEASPATRLYGSVVTINQFLHLFRNSGVFNLYPTVFWYPSTEKTRPTTSLQATAGIRRDLKEGIWEISLESFYRATNGLHEVPEIVSMPAEEDLGEAMLTGSGRSYGGTITIRKRVGDISGSLQYILSWNENTFAALNGGEPFSSGYDRRHEVQADIQFRPDESWAFNIVAVLSSGRSLETASLTTSASGPVIPRGDPQTENARAIAIDVNGSRLPGFQRLELGVQYHFLMAGTAGTISFRLLNSYGLLDPISWDVANVADPRLLWQARLKTLHIFPLFPTLGLLVNF
jgi:hypothetical protein